MSLNHNFPTYHEKLVSLVDKLKYDLDQEYTQREWTGVNYNLEILLETIDTFRLLYGDTHPNEARQLLPKEFPQSLLASDLDLVFRYGERNPDKPLQFPSLPIVLSFQHNFNRLIRLASDLYPEDSTLVHRLVSNHEKDLIKHYEQQEQARRAEEQARLEKAEKTLLTKQSSITKALERIHGRKNPIVKEEA